MTITVEKALQQLNTLLKIYREKRGLSQRGLVRCSGCSIATISDAENFKKGMNVSTLLKVVNALEIPVEEIARAMREEVPELIVQRKKAECCGNCRYFDEELGFCEFLEKNASACEVCMKFEEV